MLRDLALVVLGGVASGFALLATPPSPTAELPGARAEIDAARHPSLQAALDAVPVEGGLVRVPPGRFELDEPLVIRTANTFLVGSGPATEIVNRCEPGQATLRIEHADGREVADDDRLWRVQLRDLRLIGQPGSGPGVVALRIQEVLLDSLTITGHGDDGVRLDHCYEDPRVVDCLITYNAGAGLHCLGCHDIVVSANQFEENQEAVRCVDGFNLCMTGNNVDDHLGAGVVIENTYGSVVAANMLEECQGAAVILDRDCYGTTISANVIAHNGAGVDARDAHGCAISANTFTIMHTDAIRVGPGSSRLTLSANNFSDSAIGEGQRMRRPDDRAAAGIVLDGSSELCLSGNLFSGLRPHALRTTERPTTRCALTGNVYVDAPVDLENLHDSLLGDNHSVPPKPAPSDG